MTPRAARQIVAIAIITLLVLAFFTGSIVLTAAYAGAGLRANGVRQTKAERLGRHE